MSTLFDLLAAIGQFLTVWPGPPMRKRVFSPGFVIICIIVVTLELAILITMFND